MSETTPQNQYWISPVDLAGIAESCPRLTLKELVVISHRLFGVKLRVVFSREDYEEGTVAVELDGEEADRAEVD